MRDRLREIMSSEALPSAQSAMETGYYQVDMWFLLLFLTECLKEGVSHLVRAYVKDQTGWWGT